MGPELDTSLAHRLPTVAGAELRADSRGPCLPPKEVRNGAPQKWWHLHVLSLPTAPGVPGLPDA